MNSTNYEASLISLMLSESEYSMRGTSELIPEDFSDPFLRSVFISMITLQKNHDPIDLVTVTEKIGFSEASRLSEVMTKSVGMPSHYDFYVQKLKDCRKLRDFENGMKPILTEAEDGNVEAIEEAAQLLQTIRSSDTIASGKASAIECMQALIDLGEMGSCVSSGFPRLDRLLKGGLHREDLIIVAGRPSMGKSAFAMNIALSVCRSGGKVAFFSLETNKTELYQRMISSISRFSVYDLRDDYVRTEKALKEAESFDGWNLFLFDRPGQTVEDIISACYRTKGNGNLDLVIIDYLGMIATSSRKNKPLERYRQIGEYTHSLKALARELKCPVILVCQLNRDAERRQNPRPLKSDLRESGDIEQDADVILFPFRPNYYETDEVFTDEQQQEAYIIVSKNRNGAVGDIPVRWHGEIFTFDPA